MRRALLAVPFIMMACGKAETPAADSAAPAAAPAALTDADVSGTWTGTAMMEGTDSVIAHWTQVCSTGTCRGTSQENPDTVVSTYVIAADSSIGTSQPFADKTMGGVMLIDNWVVRVMGNQATGTGKFTLASKPDSVVMRYRIVGSKAP